MAEHVEVLQNSEFNRQRANTDALRSKCSKGYIFSNAGSTVKNGKTINFVNAAGQCAFHHILPITSLQDANITVNADELEHVHLCMAATKWDINDTPNLIGLPLKPAYQSADRLLSDDKTIDDIRALNPARGQFGAIPDLPCHQNDHNKFNDAVISYLNSKVWKKLKPAEPCESKSENIKSQLDKASKKFLSKIETQGGKEGGAVDCWVNREEKPSTWHIPFSMDVAGDPPSVPPPPRLPGSRQKAWLQSLFQRM